MFSFSSSSKICLEFGILEYDFLRSVRAFSYKRISVLCSPAKALSVGSFLYMKDPADKHNIIIDEKTDWIVRKEFGLVLSGMATRKIATVMNAENIPTPNERKKELTNMDYEYNIVYSENRKNLTWTNGTVTDMLSNENYTGTYGFNMQEKSVLTPEKFGYGNQLSSSKLKEFDFRISVPFIKELEAYLVATGLKDYRLTKYDEEVLDKFNEMSKNPTDRQIDR